jgi:hypothetical protein
MTERLQPSGSGQRTARRRTPRSRSVGVWGARTIPGLRRIHAAPQTDPTILGFPAEYADEDGGADRIVDEPGPGVSAPRGELVVLRRADRFGGGALVLAGVAANVSLMLSWSTGEGPTGLSLVQRGGEVLDAGLDASVRSGVWQPLVVVLSGGLLVVLGLLLLVPARAHRLLGVLALLVALAAAAAVVFLLADNGWMVDRFGPGMWCAIAVPVLGVLGALKAMLTPPLVTLGAVDQ